MPRENIMPRQPRVSPTLPSGARSTAVERLEGKNIPIEKPWMALAKAKIQRLPRSAEAMYRDPASIPRRLPAIIAWKRYPLSPMSPPRGFEKRETMEATPATRPTRKGVAFRVIAKGEIMGLTTLIPRKKKKVDRFSSHMSLRVLSMAQTPA